MTSAIKVEDLKQLVLNIEKLEDQKSDISNEIKDVYITAKAKGYDIKTLKKVISLRKRDKEKLAEEDALMEMYRSALDI